MQKSRKDYLESFYSLLGPFPDKEPEFRRRHRIHQGWWRMSVLLEEAGPNPANRGANVCNTFNIVEGDFGNKRSNYLDYFTPLAVQEAMARLKMRSEKAGLIQEPRIWNNLLSSQPLTFNFWAPLKNDPTLANKFLPALIPGFKYLIDIEFEWAPEKKYTGDRSAYDILIKYKDIDGEEVWLGIEVKYTDSFSKEKYDRPEYRDLYSEYGEIFKADYEEFIRPKYNQLFRNQLIACSLDKHQNRKAWCGLFITERDESAAETALEYRRMLKDAEVQFVVLTYEKFIEALQRADLAWSEREWSMMLWARYLGMSLSDAADWNIGLPERTESPF